jgi:hypothetical protein
MRSRDFGLPRSHPDIRAWPFGIMIKTCSSASEPATAGRPKCCATSSATDNLAWMLASDSRCSARPLGVMSTSTERTSAGSGGPLHQPQPLQPTNRPGDGGGKSARFLSPTRGILRPRKESRPAQSVTVTQMAKGYTECVLGVSRPERVEENAGALCVQSRPKPTSRDLHRLVSAAIYIESLTGEPLSPNGFRSPRPSARWCSACSTP